MYKRGFSLMEMMVVLLIVAIVAAASAPMVSRKMGAQDTLGAGDCHWQVFNDDSKSISYNAGGKSEKSVIIGAKKTDDTNESSETKPRLFVKTSSIDNSQIQLSNDNDDKKNLNLAYYFKNVWFSTKAMKDVLEDEKSDMTVIGYGASSNETGGIAIGSGANSTGSNAIALGIGANASALSSIAIGTGTNVYDTAYNSISIGTGSNVSSSSSFSIAIGDGAEVYASNGAYHSIAIGTGAEVNHPYSIAMGYGAKSKTENQIVLGNEANDDGESGKEKPTVYIPGNLVVDGDVVLARNIGSKVYARMSEKGATNPNDTGIFPLQHETKDGFVPESSYNVIVREHNIYTRTSFGTNEENPDAHLGIIRGEYSSSDRRLKNVGEVFKGGLAEIKKLEVFNYVYKKDTTKTPRVGVMAQDLQKIFPNAVFKGDDGFLRIRMEDMFYALVNAVKELDKRIDLLVEKQKKIDELEKRVDTLEKRLAKLEKLVKEK